MTHSPVAKASPFCHVLPNPCIIEVHGADAPRVLNNLCTNDIQRLAVDHCLESFVTDVRGWVVAHGMVVRLDGRVFLVGSHPNPDRVVAHIERYIIREDATVSDCSATHAIVVVDGLPVARLPGEIDGKLASQRPAEDVGSQSDSAVAHLRMDSEARGLVYRMPVTGSDSLAICCEHDQIDFCLRELGKAGVRTASQAEFEFHRIANFWPFIPQDIGDKSIPQELDRDGSAISFSKGCYLGQETIARLDARGQLQKKLCLVQLHGELDASLPRIAAGDSLSNTEKMVGWISSVGVSPDGDRGLALAWLKRGSFSGGTSLTCSGRIVTVVV